MFPPIEECQKRIHDFDSRYYNSTFDDFWSYKLDAEVNGSILDHSHLNKAVTLLDEKLLRHPKWGLWWTGIPTSKEIRKILTNICSEYETIKNITLGNGQIAEEKVTEALSLIYTKLCGITHNRWGDFPDSEGKSYLVGKSKVLMFIWGQVPGFDSRLRENASLWLLPHLWTERRRYTPLEFCDIVKELDNWVAMFDKKYGKRAFQNLSLNRPVGRIIDIIYWIEPKAEKRDSGSRILLCEG